MLRMAVVLSWNWLAFPPEILLNRIGMLARSRLGTSADGCAILAPATVRLGPLADSADTNRTRAFVAHGVGMDLVRYAVERRVARAGHRFGTYYARLPLLRSLGLRISRRAPEPMIDQVMC